MTWPAAAQVSGMGGMGSRGFGRGHHDHAQTSDAPTKRVDDKDYNAALQRLPDKKVDPWADKH
jgi:hypothetical protein